MAKYSYITDKTHNNRKIQVESAKRDGSGKNIENNYAKQNGNYQSLTAGLSNNFDTKKVMVDESAYNFRPTATMGSVELEVGSPCKVKKIIGGSVAFNQLRANNLIGGSVNLNLTYNWVDIGAQSQSQLVVGHKYYVSVKVDFDPLTEVDGELKLKLGDFGYSQFSITIPVGSSGKYEKIDILASVSGASSKTIGFQTGTQRGLLKFDYSNFNVIDLTKMFGSTIADYIYSLEQANAGSGVAWFKRYFPKEYYAYNSGELVSVKTQGKKITHFNQFDKTDVVLRKLVNSNGTELNANDYFHSNYINCVPNTNYYFKSVINWDANVYVVFFDKDKNVVSAKSSAGSTPMSILSTSPSNAYYMIINGYIAYIDDTCINFHYDGERDGEYEPYNSETYACDDIELRGIPQLDENNNLAFDGDEYSNDGNVKRKYALINLGEQNWTYLDGGFFTQISNCSPTSQTIRCSKYNIDTTGNPNNMQDKSICFSGYSSPYNIVIKDSSYTNSQTAEFKASLDGVYLLAPLTTPTDENSIPFTEVQECDNWGTEEWLAPTTDTRPCEVPVGHETDYLPDLKAKLEVAPNTPNENGVYVMEHSASGNTYTPIATWLADNGYVKPTSISGYDSTKTQTIKNVEGTLTWVDDE
jgi:hypothetical protein